MESPRPSDPPDLNEVKLRILGGDPEAYFQNTLIGKESTKNGMTMSTDFYRNVSSKSVDEFQKGVPRDMKVPTGMIALLEDQNKNRLKSATTAAASSVANIVTKNSSSVEMSSSGVTPFTAIATSNSNNEVANGKNERCEVKSSGNISSHVEIDVDMTLAQEEARVAKLTGDALVSKSESKEITCNGQTTNSSRNNSHSSSVNILLPCQEQALDEHKQHEFSHQTQQLSPKLAPSCEKDLEILKNVRKVFVQLTDDNTPCYYKVSDESQGCLFETVLGETNGSIWSRYFKQQQKVILVHDRNQRGVLKLEFGRSRTISCCQTLRFAAMTASFKLKPEEPLCIIFKDKECCVSCCCCPEATYETVPQLDSIHPFSVFTKGRWKNRAELMVKHNDGSILGFIDKEQNSYSLTMGENLKPAMKACLIGFLIAMDVMDRQDAGKLSCYLRPTTILLITLLLMLCITIGGYLLHHFSSMFLLKEDSILCGTFDEAGSRRTAPVPHFNNDRTSDSSILSSSSGEEAAGLSPPSTAFNASSLSSSSSSFTSEFHFGFASLSSSGGGAASPGGNNSSST